MLSTFTDYRSITANLSKSIDRTASEASTKNEVRYFQDHIGSVGTVDAFLKDTRLYTFAMKAYGLDDMIYAKGFMRKVLLGEPDANGRVLVDRLQDSRYRDFAAAFSFRAYGDDPSHPKTSSDPEIQALLDAVAATKKSVDVQKTDYDQETEGDIQYLREISQYITALSDIEEDSKLSSIVRQAVGLAPAQSNTDPSGNALQLDGKVDVETFRNPERLRQFIDQFFAARQQGRKAIVEPYFRSTGTYADSDAEIARQVRYLQARLNGVSTAKDIVADPVLADIVRTAVGLPSVADGTSGDVQAQQIAKKLDVASLRDPKTLSAFTDRFKDARIAARTATVDAYVRQSLETEAGSENQGVRLALYFRRKAPEVKSAYGFLADPALAEVVRTALGLPAESAKVSVDSQARLIARKIDITSLKDPAKLDQFIKRFTILWDSKNSTATTPALSLLAGTGSGLDSDLLLKLQGIRKGGL
jgi:hypothetical protein